MENNNRMLKELVTLDVLYQLWCIPYSQLEPAQSYELKSSLIHLLPKFHGLTGGLMMMDHNMIDAASGGAIAVPAESKSRAVYRPEILTHPRHAGSKLEKLSVAGSKIRGTIIPPTTATTGSATGHFTFNGRVDEVDE
ncbi:hypothetical protein CR513_01187, partial [Mucuna pruriens]